MQYSPKHDRPSREGILKGSLQVVHWVTPPTTTHTLQPDIMSPQADEGIEKLRKVPKANKQKYSTNVFFYFSKWQNINFSLCNLAWEMKSINMFYVQNIIFIP